MMNEKLTSLLETVRRTAVQAGDAAADAAYSAGKVAGELLVVAKLNVRIMERKAAVNAALKEVGEILYATHTGNPSDSEILLAKLQEIDALKALLGVQATLVAAGGIWGCEGAAVFAVEGTEEQLAACRALAKELQA